MALRVRFTRRRCLPGRPGRRPAATLGSLGTAPTAAASPASPAADVPAVICAPPLGLVTRSGQAAHVVWPRPRVRADRVRVGRCLCCRSSPCLQLRIALEEVHPPIWRRLLVPGSVRLDKLHRMFQAAMRCANRHLHSFRVGDALFGTQFDDRPDEELDEKASPWRAR
jgi:Plasmid pRiA4b ORF-3-like protein